MESFMRELRFGFGHFWSPFLPESSEEMPNFPLSRLPGILRAEIFSKVEPNESLKFLKTTVELRHFVLNNGPFSKRIQKMTIDGNNQQRSASGELLVDQLTITISTKTQKWHIQVVERREFGSGFIGITVGDLVIFKNIRDAKELSVSFRDSLVNHGQSIRICDFLPTFRYLQEFGLREAKPSSYARILAKLRAEIDHDFIMHLDNHKKEVNFEGKAEICEFISKSLDKCQVIFLSHIDRICAGPDLYAALQKTNFSALTLVFRYDEDEFWTAVEAFLVNPLASRNSEWELEIQGRLAYSRKYEYPSKINESLCRHTERLAGSHPDNPILSRFTGKGRRITPKARMEISGNQDRRVKYFRRTLSDQKAQIFYVFLRLGHLMEFWARIERL